jgi:predicted RNA-binding Zn ribbon-like protein
MVPKQVVSSRDVPAEFIADFVNTRADGAGHVELFATSDDLRSWGAQRQVLDTTAIVTESDVMAAHELREALRTVLRAHAHDPELSDVRLKDAEDYLRQAASRYPLTALITARRAQLIAPADGVPGLFGTVLAAVVETELSGEWALLKSCSFSRCQFAFVDRTRNHSGRYCCTNCASRVSMRALRERQRQAASQPG